MSKAIFYHAGTAVCNGAKQVLPDSINQEKYQIEPSRRTNLLASQTNAAGIGYFPTLLLSEPVFHINFGAALADLKF